MSIADEMKDMARRAKAASRAMLAVDGAAKSRALVRLAELIEADPEDVRTANAKDLENAAAAGMDAPRMDRLRLTPKVMGQMAAACREVAAMSDPVGEIETMWQRPNGLMVGKMRIPMGVICMIFESRPNVTIDSAILCLKAGNAVILKGGSEAIHSNMALAALLRQALMSENLPADAAQLVESTDRASVAALCKLDEYIDVMIPRGGEGLIRAVVEQASMPVLKHYKGVCHAYADQDIDYNEALEIVHNAKVQRPGVCNALECLLVHENAAKTFLPLVAKRLGADGVTFKACEKSLPLLGDKADAAAPEDWGYEFHDLILAVKVVSSMDEAIDHIAQHGSGHTEVILTKDYGRSMDFIRRCDASMVGVNCSTRFNDGGELGLGAEIGISTSKLHAYGPMGVKELTSSKYVVLGRGQVRQ